MREPFRPSCRDETFVRSGEAIFMVRRRRPETWMSDKGSGQTTGFGHVGVHYQLCLPRVLQEAVDRDAKAEVGRDGGLSRDGGYMSAPAWDRTGRVDSGYKDSAPLNKACCIQASRRLQNSALKAILLTVYCRVPLAPTAGK
jgi:hypothetical protein